MTTRSYPHWLERAATAALKAFGAEPNPVAAAQSALVSELPAAFERAAESYEATRRASNHWASRSWEVGPLYIFASPSGNSEYDVAIAEDDETYTIQGLPTVAEYIWQTLNMVHEGDALDIHVGALEKKLHNFRTALSRAGGDACARIEYCAGGDAHLLVVDIARG